MEDADSLGARMSKKTQIVEFECYFASLSCQLDTKKMLLGSSGTSL